MVAAIVYWNLVARFGYLCGLGAAEPGYMRDGGGGGLPRGKRAGLGGVGAQLEDPGRACP